jgi:hypothetical protein
MYCIVVKRGSFQSYDLLHQAFGQKVPIVWDRRLRNRRASLGTPRPDRRRKQRRGGDPASWTGLDFVVVQRREVDFRAS